MNTNWFGLAPHRSEPPLHPSELPSRLRADGPRGESPAEIRHRTLAELKRTVQKHLAVDGAARTSASAAESANGERSDAVSRARGVREDDGRFRELEAAFDALILGCDADSAELRIEWRPRPDPGEPAYFVFHYHDSTGRDFGWHREPNPHVDGLEHFQARESGDDEYEYEPASFESPSPVHLLWEVLGRVEERVGSYAGRQ